MNVKKLIFCCAVVVALSMISLPSMAQEEALKTLNFNFTNIIGKVLDENKNPLPNIKLEVELAPDAELRANLSVPPIQLDVTIENLVGRVGSGVFMTAVTNENGEYALKGIPTPGGFYIHARNMADYYPTYLKIFLNPREGKEYPVREIVLVKRQGKAISDKAIKELEKFQKSLAEKKIKEAMQHLQKALELDPEYAEGYYNMAMLLMESKKVDEAVKNLEKAVELQKDYKNALKSLGELYFYNKAFDKAAAAFSHYLALREKEGNITMDEVKIYFQTGNCLKALKNNEQAVPLFIKYIEAKQKLASIEKQDSLLLNDLGSFYYSKSDMNNAITFYSKAIEANPEINPETYMYLGNSYVFIKDGVNGIKNYRKYIELAPKGQYIPQIKAMLEKLEKIYPDAK